MPSPKYTLQPKKPTKEPPRLRRVMGLIIKQNLDRTIHSINNDFIPSPRLLICPLGEIANKRSPCPIDITECCQLRRGFSREFDRPIPRCYHEKPAERTRKVDVYGAVRSEEVEIERQSWRMRRVLVGEVIIRQLVAITAVNYIPFW